VGETGSEISKLLQTGKALKQYINPEAEQTDAYVLKQGSYFSRIGSRSVL